MTLEKAIKMLEEEYERAKKFEWVHNPLAYALHKVWKRADAPTKKTEDKPKKYFTPEEVRNMTREEVRANYTAIINSMKEWN